MPLRAFQPAAPSAGGSVVDSGYQRVSTLSHVSLPISPRTSGLFDLLVTRHHRTLIWVDAEGDPLDGSKRYELHLEKTPPVDGFWSLTMYRPPEFYLVANPIERYSIGDRTPGLKTGEDGSVTIYIQKVGQGLTIPHRAFPRVRRGLFSGRSRGAAVGGQGAAENGD